jgi:hypothetical protein
LPMQVPQLNESDSPVVLAPPSGPKKPPIVPSSQHMPVADQTTVAPAGAVVALTVGRAPKRTSSALIANELMPGQSYAACVGVTPASTSGPGLLMIVTPASIATPL